MTDEQPTVIDEKLIGRIRKLLALSTSPNEHEAAQAAAKAAALLQDHNLSMAAVADRADGQTKRSRVIEAGVLMDEDTKARHQWVVVMAAAIAESCFCHPLFSRTAVYFIGREDNATVAKTMFADLVRQLKVAAINHVHEHKLALAFRPGNPKKQKRDAIKGFMLGAAYGIRDALAEQQATFTQRAGATALVVVTGREITEYMEKIYPELTQFKVRKSDLFREDYAQGYTAGKEAASRHGQKQIESPSAE